MSLVAQCLRGSGPVPRSKSRIRLKARENEVRRSPSTSPGKQREERRAEWKTQRRQVIKVPGGAVLRGCKKTKRKLMAHFQLRAGVHSQLRVIASLYVLRIFLTCLLGLPRIGKGLAEQREFVFNPATQIGVGIDPGVTQAVSAASGRWLAPIKPHLQHLAAASSAGTSLEANLKHITATLATWDAVWEVYLDPKWAEQRLRLYGAQDRTLEQFFKKLEEDMAEVSMERHGRAKQLVVFFGAASIGTRGGWGADAVLRACCKVVCRPRGTDQGRGRVVLVDEHRTTRVSSAVNGQQPCERQLNKRRATRPTGWKPPAGQVEPRLLRPAWSQQRDQPVRGMMWCPVVAPRKPPQFPSQQPGSHTGSSLRARAQHSPASQAQQAHQG
ncbi:hypothetical protein QJQ45_000851 [Haematococcus lacustris]|nr:hypothetical protein QJQ45_000851 [Haematococcus lacustris]